MDETLDNFTCFAEGRLLYWSDAYGKSPITDHADLTKDRQVPIPAKVISDSGVI